MAKRRELHVQRVVFVHPLNERGKRPYVIPTALFYVVCIWDIPGFGPKAVKITFRGNNVVTDGASTFWPISLLVPQWRPGDDLYNVAALAHDLLYVKRGRLTGATLTREECDDLLRGIWRVWGMSRGLAGTADKAIQLLAGGDSHWGNDDYHIQDKFTITLEELD